MRSVRISFISSAIIALAGLGLGVYLMFWGPDRLQLEGRTLWQILVDDGVLLVLIMIPAVLIITIVLMLPFLRIIFPGEIKNAVTAQAKVLKVWDTGVSINDNPQVGLLLEVSPARGAPFQVETQTMVSRLNAGLVQPGIKADIKYDPKNTRRLQVVTLHVDGGGSGSAATRLEELNNLRDKALITEEEYREKREEILKAL
jgi:hypothetical protein